MADWEENRNEENFLEGVAIIGLAGRFPKAQDVETFWQNLCAGIEGITFLTEEEDPSYQLVPELKNNPDYVPAGAFLDDIDLFDASFFGYNAREAQMIDPQQRLFLEASWEALERAGYDSKQYDGRIGVFAGAGANFYFRHHLYPKRGIREQIGAFQLRISNDNDYVATRVSYKLDLKGPSFTVQTGCSTSLTAIGLACQSLMNFQSDIALAGGVSIGALDRTGYLYEQGSILSPDGHNRTFDADANGTVPGNGLGVVVLKRLEEAVADGDQIYAVIKSVAINNDGDSKMGFTAPSIEGQTEVILEALGLAGVDAESISYVEAHGTATNIGDPIEVTGLTQAFRATTDKTGYCAVGSVKSNLGHLDVAAGVAGLIKTTLSLHHKTLVPSLHYTKPNPEIDFANSPFYVNTELKAWPAGTTPRRAGVSSFGLGGTNVHAILEEAPEMETQSGPSRQAQLLMLSAKTRTALEQMTDNLADYLEAHPEIDLADAAYTLQVGRRAFNNRRVLVGTTREEIIAELRARTPQKVLTSIQEPTNRPLAFLFSGQGGQYVQMARGLYESEAVFRDVVDECAAILTPHLGLDLRDVLFPQPHQVQEAETALQQMRFMQPALFVIQYATTQLLAEWGLKAEAMIGHSIGEFAAACYAGVMSLSDALHVVTKRGQFMQEMEKGAMLSINLPEQDVLPYLTERLSLAAVNGPALCVVSGIPADVHELAERLSAAGIESRVLHISCGAHSWMMEEASVRLREVLAQVTLNAPQIPFVSCATGTWITDEQASSPDYWAKHLVLTVRYAEGIRELLRDAEYATVEIGPGQAMTMMLRQQQELAGTPSITTIRHPHDVQSDLSFLLQNVGRLWLSGVTLDASGFFAGQTRRRVLLPTYPFERRRYWVEVSTRFAYNLEGGDDQEGALAEEEEIGGAEIPRSALMSEYVAPRNDTEQKLAEIWEEFLGVDQIGVHDNFFELGGHSLLGIKLMKKTRETFEIDLSERLLYESPTVADLADAIETSGGAAMQKIMPIPRDQDLLASWTQEKIWRREQKYPGDSYAVSIGFEMFGQLDHKLFEQALTEMVKRHETLRTSFTERADGQLLQVIHEPFAATVPLIDLTHLPSEEREAEMCRHAYDEERVPFDMTQAPLWRMHLYRLDEAKYAWFLSGHGAIWDGISQHVVVNELHDIYVALEKGEPWSLPELTVQYADYAQWEREHFSGATYEKGMNYWRERFTDPIEQLDLPTDRPRTEKWHGLGQFAYRMIPKSVGDRLKALGAEHGATLYMTMLSGFKMLFSRFTGQKDLLVETSFANRTASELDHLIAPLSNFVGLRTDLSDNPTFREVLDRSREAVLGAIEYSNFPFAKVMEELQPQIYSKPSPYLRVLVTFHTHRDFKGIPGMELGERLWARRALFDFYVSITDFGEEGVIVTSEYNADLFDKATIDNMFRRYEELLTLAVENPDIRLSELQVGELIHA